MNFSTIHSHFNKIFYFLHPHIYNYMDKILELQSKINIQINSLNEPNKFQNTKSKKEISNNENNYIIQ
ncbi:Uncharacterized protein FWK35_00001471 [Aphis craccivora]|uniref:Uncharacterized protein n=1 Tax=Aphis craccivora TaxID=307492 RepID=A0A6G0ZM18_APHCR|nr:Uncharacterized protein FWK35_00001471 [Aphis craccivora]